MTLDGEKAWGGGTWLDFCWVRGIFAVTDTRWARNTSGLFVLFAEHILFTCSSWHAEQRTLTPDIGQFHFVGRTLGTRWHIFPRQSHLTCAPCAIDYGPSLDIVSNGFRLVVTVRSGFFRSKAAGLGIVKLAEIRH